MKSIKKNLFITLILTVSCLKLFASPAAINFDNLSKDEQFVELFTNFENVFSSIANPDIGNKSKYEEELKIVNDLYSYLNIKKKLNYDEQITKLLTMRCLYNFDDITFDSVEKEYKKINKKFSKNPEHHWIYGNFLVSSGKCIEGKKELEEYLDMKNYMVGSFFLQDYAYAQYLCNLPIHAYYTITNGGVIPEENIQNQSLLKMIKNQIKESSSSEKYETDQVWKLSKKDDGYIDVYSTMLGVSIPCKGEWNLKLTPFTSNSGALCYITPNDLKLNDKKLSISLILIFFPDSIYQNDLKEKYLNQYPIINKENVKIDKTEFEKYTFEDLSKYNDDRKGLRGYLYFGTIMPSPFSGARCEHEIDLQKLMQENEGEEAIYYRIANTQNHLKEPIHVVILVDSCNAVSEETIKLLDDIFSKTIME